MMLLFKLKSNIGYDGISFRKGSDFVFVGIYISKYPAQEAKGGIDCCR